MSEKSRPQLSTEEFDLRRAMDAIQEVRKANIYLYSQLEQKETGNVNFQQKLLDDAAERYHLAWNALFSNPQFLALAGEAMAEQGWGLQPKVVQTQVMTVPPKLQSKPKKWWQW